MIWKWEGEIKVETKKRLVLLKQTVGSQGSGGLLAGRKEVESLGPLGSPMTCRKAEMNWGPHIAK